MRRDISLIKVVDPEDLAVVQEQVKDFQDLKTMVLPEIVEVVEVVLVVEHHVAVTEIQEIPEEIGDRQEIVQLPVPQLVRGMLEFSSAPQIHLEVEKSIIDVL